MRRAAWLVLLLIIAGCGGESAPEAATTDSDVLPAGVTNRLEGTIQGPDLLPLEGALVEILGHNETKTTGPDGYYAFDNLPPRDYTLVVRKDGFKAKQARAIVG